MEPLAKAVIQTTCIVFCFVCFPVYAMIRHHHRRRRPPNLVGSFASWKHLISRQHLVIAQQVKLVQPVVEARGLIIQAFFAIVAKPFQDGIKHAELKHLRFLVLLSKYDNLRLRLDRVQFEMGDDRHHPLCSLWLRH